MWGEFAKLRRLSKWKLLWLVSLSREGCLSRLQELVQDVFSKVYWAGVVERGGGGGEAFSCILSDSDC